MNKSLALAALFISSSCFAAVNTSLVDAITKSELDKVEFMLNGTNIVTKDNKAAYLELAQQVIEQRKDAVQEWLKPYISFKLGLRSSFLLLFLQNTFAASFAVDRLSIAQNFSKDKFGEDLISRKQAEAGVAFLFSALCFYLTYNTIKDCRLENQNKTVAFTNAMKIKHLIQLC